MAGKFKFAEAYTEMTLKGWSAFTSRLEQSHRTITDALIEPFRQFERVVVSSFSRATAAIQGLVTGPLRAMKKVAGALFSRTGLLAGGLGVYGLGRLVGHWIHLGSQLEEIEAKFDAVFKEQAKLGRAFATDFAKNIRRSKSEIMGFMASLQDTFVPLGFARDKAREMSQAMVRLTYDLTSFNPEARNAAESLDLMRSALVGNHEAVRRFGIIITEATLKQKLLEMGYKGSYQAATNQLKVLARAIIIFESTRDAMGDLVRTGGSFKNIMAALYATLKTGAEKVGTALIPVAKGLADLADALLGLMEKVTGTQMGTVAKTLEHIGDVIRGIAARVRAIDFGQWRQQLGKLATDLGGVLKSAFEAIWLSVVLLGRMLGEEIAIAIATKLKQIFPSLTKAIRIPERQPRGPQAIAMDLFWRRAGAAAENFAKGIRGGGAGAGAGGGFDLAESLKATIAEYDKILKQMYAEGGAMAKQIAAQEEMTNAMKQWAKLQQQLRTPMETYRDTMNDLIGLSKILGAQFDETFKRAKAAAEEALEKAEGKEAGRARGAITMSMRAVASHFDALKQEENKQLKLAEVRNKALAELVDGVVIKEMPDVAAVHGP